MMTTPIFAYGRTDRVAPYRVLGRDDEPLGVVAVQLGFATSHRSEHTHPVTSEIPHAHRGDRCSACRWFEVTLYRVERVYTCAHVPDDHVAGCPTTDPPGRYLVVTSGTTTVPGETTKRRAEWTNASFEVLELLTQRRAGDTFMPATSARALSQAAERDPGLRNAYLSQRAA